MVKKKFNFIVFKEDGIYIVRCIEFLITESSDSEEEAIKKTIESIKFHKKEYGLKEYNFKDFSFKDYKDYKIRKIEIDI